MNPFALARHRDDIQALVGFGMVRLRHCRFLLLEVTDRSAARAWLAEVMRSGLVHSVAALTREGRRRAGVTTHDQAVALAFSHKGLRRLGIRDSREFPFPTPFRRGMADPRRAALLHDASRANWGWGDRTLPRAGLRAAHVLVAHYWSDAVAEPADLRESAPGSGLRRVATVATCPSFIQPPTRNAGGDEGSWLGFEPFGFRDGIAQPVIRGLRDDGSADARGSVMHEDNVVASGEFVLGHVNEFGERAYCPDVAGWPAHASGDASISRFALNGSYIAVRQIEQDVAAFRDYEEQTRNDEAGANADAPTPVEAMMGRRKDGRPLVTCPHAAGNLEDFRYRVDDHEGFQCPRGAHVRRANPRDTLAWDVDAGVAVAKLHRLLRRGRVYAHGEGCAAGAGAQCGADGKRHDCGAGLMFLALNADLYRQFEFVQQRWIGSNKFGDLYDEDDPNLGTARPRAFSRPALPVGQRYQALPDFTTVVGGGYFFLPGMSALRFIAGMQPPRDAGSADEAEAALIDAAAAPR